MPSLLKNTPRDEYTQQEAVTNAEKKKSVCVCVCVCDHPVITGRRQKIAVISTQLCRLLFAAGEAISGSD